MPSLDFGKVVGPRGPTGPVAQGTMAAAVYDPNGHAADIFAYADAAEAAAKAASRPAGWTPSASDVGAAAAVHNHGAGDINSGELSVARGGTGKGSWSANGLVYASSAAALGQVGVASEANSLLTQSPGGAPAWQGPAAVMGLLGASKVVPFRVHLNTRTNQNNYINTITEAAGIKMVVPIRCMAYISSRWYYMIPTSNDGTDDSPGYLYGMLTPGQSAGFVHLDVNEHYSSNNGDAVLPYDDGAQRGTGEIALASSGTTLTFSVQDLTDYAYDYYFGGFYVV